MYVLVHCLTTRFAHRTSRFCLIPPPSLADMHTLYSKTRAPHGTFCRFGFTVYRHGRRWFHAIATFRQAEPAETRVQELTRTSILGHSHTQTKRVAATDRVVAVPIGTSGAIRVIPPATSAYDAEITGNSTFPIRWHRIG